MTVFEYDARTLPQITLIGKDRIAVKHRNICRTSEDYIYYVVTDGELFLREGETDYHLTRGDCFLFEPGLPHGGTADSVYNLVYIHFRHPDVRKIDVDDASLPDYSTQGQVVLPKRMHISITAGLNHVLSLLHKAIERNNVVLDNYDILCACSVQEAFLELGRLCVNTGDHRDEAGLRIVNETMAYLNGNYSRKLTGSIIEKECSYSFDYLNQLFRRYLSSTVFKTLESIRIENAQNLILTSKLPVKKIATEVGYSDEAYFSKVFKRHYGLSPLQYRQSFKKDYF